MLKTDYFKLKVYFNYTKYTKNDLIILKLQPESLPEATYSDPSRGSGKIEKVCK